MDQEELPRVSPAHLRRADDPSVCRRRLAGEHRGGKQHANNQANARFATANRLVADARLAHAELGLPRPEAFVEPAELEPEQRHLYRAAVAGYLLAFGDVAARAVDLGWRTELPDVRIDLVGDVGLAVELEDGACELRVLKLGGRRPGARLLDDVDVRIALVRTEAWAATTLRIVVADLIEQELTTYDLDVVPARAEAHEWVAARVALVQRNASDGRARAGVDCQGCAFVNGCVEHRAPTGG